MKITMFADLSGDVASGFQFPIEIRSSRESSVIQLLFGDPSDKDGPYDPNSPEPRYIALSPFGGADPNGFWAFRWKTVRVEGAGGVTRKEVMLRIKHAVLREEKALSKIQREVEAFQNMERASSSRRERLPESVRLFICNGTKANALIAVRKNGLSSTTSFP